MKRKATVLFWTDVMNFVLLVALAATGAVLKWGLPPGSGGGMHEPMGRALGRAARGAPATLLEMTRHQWGDVHFWIAVAMVAAVLAHLFLHNGWIRSACRAYFAGYGSGSPAPDGRKIGSA